MTNATTTPVVPSEVGWQFVPQYYTFVNKHPNRLHCFYTKSSTFIHGNEGEDVKPCFGQQEIHNKITSIGFEDCKVFIHSVDAQSSANSGIIIQVIGEMSNHGDPWRKFVQTFFLAEQPNGYFVLNDIFRFLKEETVEDDASDTAEVETPAAPPAEPAAAPAPVVSDPVVEPSRSPSPPPPSPPPVVAEEAPTTDVPEPAPAAQTPAPAPEPALSAPTPAAQANGIHSPAPEPEKALTPAPAPEPVAAPEPTPAPAPAAPAPAPTPPPAAAPAPPKPTTPAPAPAPAAPKTWASLAASNSKKWGAAVAQESRGVTESPAAPPAAQPAPAPRAAPQQPQQPQQGGAQPGYTGPAAAAQGITTAHCFVKGVVQPITQNLLSTALTLRFGPVKDIEVVPSKACAFLEFNTLDAARKAISASPIWIDVGGDIGQLRVSIETKKERADRPPSRPRGGAPVNGGPEGGRGGFQQRRGGGASRGRGAPAGK
ncbi:hypothetical protein C0991_004071 [Blastosporella zonata]|nr:hypothetical protein C0991_004071 [Blastosporella zonata]